MEDSCTSDTTAEIKRAQLRAELLASEHTVGASQSLPALDVNFFGSVGRPSDFVRPGGFRRRFLGLQGGGDFRAPLSRVQSLTDTLRSSALVYARATEGAAEGEPELGMGSAATVFTLLKAMLGPTCLFVPRMFSEAGVVDAVLGLFLSCALSGVGMWLLIQVREQSGLAQCTYPDLGRHHGGTAGWVLIEAALVTSQWLYCVGYPIFVAQNTHAILASCLASPPSELCLTLVQLAVCIPYCWVRRVSSLSGAMLIANLCLWSSLLVLCALLVLRLASHGSPLPPAAWADAAPRLETALFASQAVVVFEGIGLVLPATSTAISIATWGDGGDASAGTPPAAPPIIGSGPSSEDLIGMA